MAPQNASLCDRGKIAIFQRDFVEASFPVLESVTEVQSIGTWYRVADQLAQVTLTSDEANDRNWSISRLGFDQLGQLLTFLVYELQIRSVTG